MDKELYIDEFGFYSGREVSTSGKPTIICSKCDKKNYSAKLKVETKEYYCSECYRKEKGEV